MQISAHRNSPLHPSVMARRGSGGGVSDGTEEAAPTTSARLQRKNQPETVAAPLGGRAAPDRLTAAQFAIAFISAIESGAVRCNGPARFGRRRQRRGFRKLPNCRRPLAREKRARNRCGSVAWVGGVGPTHRRRRCRCIQLRILVRCSSLEWPDEGRAAASATGPRGLPQPTAVFQ